MDATAGTPGRTGPQKATAGAGGHVRRLLTLAAALTAAAEAVAEGADGVEVVVGADVAGGAGAAGHSPAAGPADPANAAGHCGVSRDSGGVSDGPVVPLPWGVDLGGLADAEVVDWAQSLEGLGRHLAALQVSAAGELAARTRSLHFDQAGITKPVNLLSTSLRLSASEASRRLRLAERFMSVTDPLTTVTTPAAQPVLATAFFTGQLSVDQALVVSGFTEDADHLAHAGRIPDQQAREMEATLTGYARCEAPDFLRRLGTRAINLLDPDGQQPTEGELLAKQGIFFRQPRHGLISFDGRMTVLQYDTLMASVGWATNPADHKDINTIDPLTGDDRADPNADLNADDTGDVHTGTSGGHNADDVHPHNAGGESGVMPGQRELWDLLRNTATTSATPSQPPPLRQPPPLKMPPAVGATAQQIPPQPALLQAPATLLAQTLMGPPGDGWPPPQGPVPDWARTPNPATSAKGYSAAESSNPAGCAGQDAVPSWPHVVNGISVPAPGSEQDLPGLDPIDPRNTDPAVQDRRTHGQKLLDGIIDTIKLAARTGKLPLNGSLKPQLFISTTQEDLEHRSQTGKPGGIALLPYSGPQPLASYGEALCDADVTTLVLGNGNEILNVGRTQRLFTASQRKILLARDLGCTFPGCTAPGYWTEAHHIIPWQDGGKTDIDNGALGCGLHHRLLHHSDWTVKLINGIPFYTPPYSIDPTQRPRRNTYHHGLPKN